MNSTDPLCVWLGTEVPARPNGNGVFAIGDVAKVAFCSLAGVSKLKSSSEANGFEIIEGDFSAV
jgi:hypothetical protein